MPAQPNQSLIHGLACLQAVITANGPLGPRELGRQLDMHHTKVSRLLGTLADLEMVERSATGKYTPGPGVHVLAAQSMAGSRLLPVALPELARLRAEGFDVSLGVMWHGKVCYLLHERVLQSVDEAIRYQRITPANRSSVGIALMAARGEDPSAHEWPVHPGLIEHPDGVAGEVAEAREAGYALRRFHDGTVSVGVAIGSPAMAALAASAKRVGESYIPEIVSLLREAAERIGRGVKEPLDD